MKTNGPFPKPESRPKWDFAIAFILAPRFGALECVEHCPFLSGRDEWNTRSQIVTIWERTPALVYSIQHEFAPVDRVADSRARKCYIT